MYINNDIDYIKFLRGKQVYIFGAGNIGKRVYKAFERETIHVYAFCDNNKAGQTIERKEIISVDEFKRKNNENVMMVVASSQYLAEMKEQLYKSQIYNFISYDQIDFSRGLDDYYDELYFAEQKVIGQFGAKIKKTYFERYITENMTVIEFGCGGGYLLNEINASRKIGVEINDVARQSCEQFERVECVKYINELPDNVADIVISTDALEHTSSPYNIILELKDKLKSGGKVCFYVPNESSYSEYHKNDRDNHLYTWNALNLGNLFKAAGYFVERIELIPNKWPSNYTKIYDEGGKEVFDELSHIRGMLYDYNKLLIIAGKR